MLAEELRFVERTCAIWRGEKYIFLAGNDYHRLSNHPRVVEAFCAAAREYGLNSAGSRVTTGNHPLYNALERRLARFLGAEAAATFSSGYLGNLVALQAIGDSFQRFFVDAAAHSSIADAVATLPCRERVRRFRHADPDDLAAQLRSGLAAGELPLVLADGVLPGSGAIPPLDAYARLIEPLGGMLLVDDAHGVAVAGTTGKGSVEERSLAAGSFIQTGTLSKGLGAFGGFVAGSRELVEAIHRRSLAFVGSTGMSLPLAAAGMAAIEIIEEHREMVSELRARVGSVRGRLRALGFTMPDSPAPILSVSFFDAAKNERLRDILIEKGIYPPFINYPGCPPGGHFRFTLSSAHTDEQVERLVTAIEEASRPAPA